MDNSRKSWPEYSPEVFEKQLQERWERDEIYRATDKSKLQKYYCLDFFPYPSGEGLHVGHCRNYLPTDVISRFKRMNGYNVLHPMGWDAFGEPTEHFAVTHGIHPRASTDQNTANFRRQMKLIGTSYDWTREIDSSRSEFYRWTQYFFLLFYRKGLAYRDTNWQWWCPECKTTLSGQEVSNGICWRGHSGVTKKAIPTWFFRITAYADELLYSLGRIDWPENIKLMQRNWIGRSEGCEIWFKTNWNENVPVFTTRPDTVYGATYLVLAPEHPLVEKLTTAEHNERVRRYITDAKSQSEIERLSEARPKTGVFCGGYVTNPLNGEQLPVWVADYVLPTYGTGAVMGVPAHDQRDFEFAHKYDLPVRVVVSQPASEGPEEIGAYQGYGILQKSGRFDGLTSEVAIREICDYLEEHDIGRSCVVYKMRDWVISRQRYWGTPIPIVYCANCGEVPIPESELPLKLPDLDQFQPDGSGKSPLARVPEFVNTNCPECGGPATRETDTMGGFACSSWYFLRFTSPHYHEGPFDPLKMHYWMPVDLYVGGAEHAVLHLLYARFWTMALADEGLLGFREPFSRLLNQGQLLAPDGQRMSKSRGNVITPDEIVDSYGADSLRIYELFIAPFENDITWNTDGIAGAHRFLNRIWNLYKETYFQSAESNNLDPDLEKHLHKTIKAVTDRIERFRFNTMVSALMEFVNELSGIHQNGDWDTATYHESLETLLVLLAPAAPHIADHLWELTGHAGTVHQQEWPSWEAEVLSDEFVEIAVQLNGKLRDVIRVPYDVDEGEVVEEALANENVIRHLAGKEFIRHHYVPGKVLNLVVK